MTIKRLILIVLTIAAIVRVLFSLGDSFSQPQVQSRLELYQADLVLHATEFQPEEHFSLSEDERIQLTTALNSLFGEEPYLKIQKQYQEARKIAETSLTNWQDRLQQISDATQVETLTNLDSQSPQSSIQKTITELNQFIAEINLKLGILQAKQAETEQAIETWDRLIVQENNADSPELVKTAQVLQGLWSESTPLPAQAEKQITDNLDGWFRYISLEKLYQLRQQQPELLQLQAAEQEIALQAVVKLLTISLVPFIGGVIGVGILIFLIVQFLIEKEHSFLASNGGLAWQTPWDGEVIWQVLIVGFFFIGQFLLPILFTILGFDPSGFSLRLKAFYILVSYLIMTFAGLTVLYFSIKQFFPLPPGWFRLDNKNNWFFWGLGGYLVALPLVVVISLINQQIWHGQGGSNPILFLALKAQDNVVLAIFFLTASVAAPFFEETIFRGFLLPSLTRYFPVWSSILISSLIFSIAHLSLSEVLPLTTLGIVLGFVYTRSRNLLAPMLLHSLWNSGTLFSLFLLGSH